ncbi:MAG: cytochrome c family protein [Sphingobium sp.]
MNNVRPIFAAIMMSGLFMAAPASAGGDAAKGKTVFVRCALCHELKPGVNKIGPSLAGLWGRKAGTADKFMYSPAMKKYAKVWNDQTLDAFLAAPAKVVPGNKMPFAPMTKADERADLIAYLKSATK